MFFLISFLLFTTSFIFVEAQGNQTQTVNCASFWPSIVPGQRNTQDRICYIYPISQAISGAKLTIAYEEIWKRTPGIGGRLDHRVGIIQQAVQETIPIYETFGANVPDLVVILGSDKIPGDAADSFMPERTGPCQVYLHFGWFGGINGTLSTGYAKQMLAHELYHCAQLSTKGALLSPFPFWVDGTAEYFSSVAYPMINLEWQRNALYSPEIPLYANNRYSTCIFFQALEQSKTAAGIHQWTVAAEQFTDPVAERGRLSRLPGMMEDFHLFAQLYTLGLIPDRGGGAVPISKKVVMELASFSGSGTRIGELAVTGVPFTMQVFSVSIDPGQTVSISYSSEQRNVAFSYRLANEANWIAMPRNGAGATLVIPCNDGVPVSIMVLFTSTDDMNQAAATVTANQITEDEACECKKPPGTKRLSKKRGLKRCEDPPPSEGACQAVSGQPTSDTCMEGLWRLDIASSETLVRERLAGTPNVVINSVAISGEGSLAISGGNASWAYQGFSVHVEVSSFGLTLPTTTTINGGFDANMYFQAPGEFCLAVYAGTGSATANSPLTGQQMQWDLGPGGGFVQQEWKITYSCSNGRLDMQGSSNGVTAFGPFVYFR